MKTSQPFSHISLGGVVRLAGIAEVKVHQAFLRRKTDCQSIGRINIKPSSKGYANDSDVFCTFGKAMKRRRVAVVKSHNRLKAFLKEHSYFHL